MPNCATILIICYSVSNAYAMASLPLSLTHIPFLFLMMMMLWLANLLCASFSPEKNTIFETFLLHSTVLQSMCIEHLSVVQFQMHSTCWALFFIAVCRCVGRRIQTVHRKHTQRVKHKQQFNVLCDGERFGASGGRLRETRLFFARWLAPGSTDWVKVTAADCSRRRHRWLLLLSYGPSAVHVLMLGVGSGGLWLHS